MKRTLFAAALLFAALLPARGAEYVVLVQDQPGGHLKVQVAPDGRTEADFSWRDNGRGPDTKERFALDARGVPVQYELTGRNTFGAEMRETYRREGGRATWQSRVDRGDEAVPDDFVFMPMDGSFAYFDAVVRLLLARPDASAPTFGGLKLKAERALRLTLPGPAGPVPLALAVVTGADSDSPEIRTYMRTSA